MKIDVDGRRRFDEGGFGIASTTIDIVAFPQLRLPNGAKLGS